MASLDTLEIQINASAKNTDAAIDKLIENLNRLDKAQEDFEKGKYKNVEKTLYAQKDADSEALKSLYELSYKPIFALLLSLTHNYQDAEDYLQETFIKIHQVMIYYQ